MQKARRFVVCLTLLLLTGIKPGACPVLSPMSLRELVLASDSIVVRRLFQVTETPERPEISSGRLRRWMLREGRLIKAQLQIAEVIKGNWVNSLVEVRLSTDEFEQLSKEKNSLWFLSKSGELGIYNIAGSVNEGIKNRTEKEIESYATHIKELLTIVALRDETTRHTQLTEWLVQCVEDPVTRSEGLSDLMRDHYRLRWQKEAAQAVEEDEEIAADAAGEPEAATEPTETNAEKDENMVAEEAGKTTAIESGEASGTGPANFVLQLTAAQKQRLMKILYRATRLGSDEIDLVELASEWGDEDYFPYLWSYLKTNQAETPSVVEELMKKLAPLHAVNEDLLKLIERYSNAAQGRPDDNDDGEEDQSEQAQVVKVRQSPADPQVLRLEFIKLIESLGPPRLIYIAADMR